MRFVRCLFLFRFGWSGIHSAAVAHRKEGQREYMQIIHSSYSTTDPRFDVYMCRNIGDDVQEPLQARGGVDFSLDDNSPKVGCSVEWGTTKTTA